MSSITRSILTLKKILLNRLMHSYRTLQLQNMTQPKIRFTSKYHLHTCTHYHFHLSFLPSLSPLSSSSSSLLQIKPLNIKYDTLLYYNQTRRNQTYRTIPDCEIRGFQTKVFTVRCCSFTNISYLNKGMILEFSENISNKPNKQFPRLASYQLGTCSF